MININPIPYGILMLVLFVVGGLWLYNKGATDCRNEYQAKHAESLTRAISQDNEIRRQNAEIVDAFIKAQIAQDKIDDSSKEVILKYVTLYPMPVSCALDACRMCHKRAAATGAPTTDCPCRMGAGLRPAADDGKQFPGRASFGLSGDGKATSLLPGYALRSGGLGQGGGDEQGDDEQGRGEQVRGGE